MRAWRPFSNHISCSPYKKIHIVTCNQRTISFATEKLQVIRPFSPAALNHVLSLQNPENKQLDLSCYESVLKYVCISNALPQGQWIHHLSIENGFHLDPFLTSLLVQMYGTCGALDDAWNTFESLSFHSLYAWNFLIRAFARHEKFEKVMLLLARMQMEGMAPSRVTLVSVLDACAGLETPDTGRRIHGVITVSKFDSELILGTSLLNMYCKFNHIWLARICFDKIDGKDVIAWTTLIAAFSQGMERLQLFAQMLQEGCMPNEVTFINLCNVCADNDLVMQGKQIHAHTFSAGLDANLLMANTIIDMYGKFGCPEIAKAVFESMESQNLVSWTSMVSAMSRNGLEKESLQHFGDMLQVGILPDNVMITTILSAFHIPAFLNCCKRMHSIVVVRQPYIDVLVGTTLVAAYGKCRSPAHAKLCFDEMVERNIFSWSSIIAAYGQNGFSKEAQFSFHQMQQEGVLPNQVTQVSIIDASTCSHSQETLKHGLYVHASVIEPELTVTNSLINMYGKCGKLAVALSLFQNMSKRDSITWNAMITILTQDGQMSQALYYFKQMWENRIPSDKATFISILSACGHPDALEKGQEIHSAIVDYGVEQDVMVGTAVITMYGRCGSVNDARTMFDSMQNRNVVSWNAILSLYEQLREMEEVLMLFCQMIQDDVVPDHLTFATLISAYVSQSLLLDGKLLHAFIIEAGYCRDIVIITSILNMYGKSGRLRDAERLFELMNERNVVTWNAMIASYAQHGLALEALDCFKGMLVENVIPNNVTFVNILGACSHSGFLEEAYEYLDYMTETGVIFPSEDHYACLIDMLGRAGCLDDAEHVLCSIPFQSSSVSFMALLGACRYRDDVDLGEYVAKFMSELEPYNRAHHLVLSSIYAAVGRVDETSHIMEMFEEDMNKTSYIKFTQRC